MWIATLICVVSVRSLLAIESRVAIRDCYGRLRTKSQSAIVVVLGVEDAYKEQLSLEIERHLAG
jgi:hypothetical protein